MTLKSIDYLSRLARVPRLQKIPNITIRSKMQAEQSILDRIQRRQLKWYGHLLRMKDSRWPKKIYQWIPHGRRRRGRPQNHGGTKWRTSWKAETWKNIFGVWEWVDGSWLYRSYIYIYIYIPIIINYLCVFKFHGYITIILSKILLKSISK